MRLKTKFSLFSTFFVIFVSLGLTLLFLIFEARYLAKKGREGQLDLTRDAAKVCKESVIVDDDLFIMNYFHSAMQTEGILYLMFVDNDKNIIVHSNTELIGNNLNNSRPEIIFTSTKENFFYFKDGDEEISEVTMPVMLQTKKLGTIHIGFSEGIIRQSIKTSMRSTTKRILGVTMFMLITGIIAALIMAKMMINPIFKLASGARTIGKGNLEHIIKVDTKDELGDLAHEFNKMSENLKELDELKDDFVHSLTHDLRSPLGAIIGYINFMLQGTFGELSQQHREVLLTIQTNSNKLMNLINDILDYAKIKSGKMELNFETANISDIIETTSDILKPLANEKHINLSCEVPKGLNILMDADKISRVLSNLISNALKFTPENGSIKISAQKDKEFIKVSVKDSGIGISKDKVDFIFKKFEQIQGSHKRSKIKGTGLGLNIAKSIVEAHGGTIWAESIEGKGATFIFTLPFNNLNGGNHE